MITEKIKQKISLPFLKFTGKKALFLLIAVFLAGNAVFIFPRLMPSSPTDLMVSRITTQSGVKTSIGTGSSPTSSGERGGGSVKAQMRQVYMEKFGLAKSIQRQYLDFWERVSTMDFGKSYAKYPTRISEVVSKSLIWTLALVLPVLPLGFVIGNWIGSRAAFHGSKIDNILYYFTMYLTRAPYYWFALLFMLIFGVYLGWFPLSGGYSHEWVKPVFSFDWFLDAAYHYCLPFLSLIGLGIGGWSVGMRAMTIYEKESDYMQFAKQLGFSQDKLRNIARNNAILPNFTQLNNALRALIGQTLLVEIVFGYPGIGLVFYNAVFAQDYPLIEASFIVTVFIVLVGNYLVIDILYGIIDPRIGTGYIEGG